MKNALLLSALALGACNSNDTPSSDADSGAARSTSSSSGGTFSDGGNGCEMVTVGPKSGTVFKSVQRNAGNIPWQDVDNAKEMDGAFAKTTLATGEESEELQISGFGFDLPDGVVFQGVEVELDRQAPDGGVVDGAIGLFGVQNQTGRGKFIATPWPSSIVGVHHYGQATDTWGMDLNPPDVERPEFGVALWVKRDPATTTPVSAQAFVDAVVVRVYHCR